MGYKHLSIDERETILKMISQGNSYRQIGDYIGRSAGTISRELSRNTSSTGEYKPHLAQRYYDKRRDASKEAYRIEQDKFIRKYIKQRLKRYWSPEQISGRIAFKKGIIISPLTIYSWIYIDQLQGGEFYKYLRQSHRRRRKRKKGKDNRGQIPDRTMIDQRPAAANARKRIGDWEGDTVEGRKGSGFIGTYVDRKARFLDAIKIADKSATKLSVATISSMGKLPSDKVRTITFDNGREFADFKTMEQQLGMKSYFARPYHSWERGTNENTNGLLRQFFPKGMDFSKITQKEVDKAVKLLNNRPRKCLGYRSPAEVFWKKPKCCASD